MHPRTWTSPHTALHVLVLHVSPGHQQFLHGSWCRLLPASKEIEIVVKKDFFFYCNLYNVKSVCYHSSHNNTLPFEKNVLHMYKIQTYYLMAIKMDLPEPTFCSISLRISWIPSVPTGNTPGAPQCHSSLFLFHRNNRPVWTAIAWQSSSLLPAEPGTHGALEKEFIIRKTDFLQYYNTKTEVWSIQKIYIYRCKFKLKLVHFLLYLLF